MKYFLTLPTIFLLVITSLAQPDPRKPQKASAAKNASSESKPRATSTPVINEDAQYDNAIAIVDIDERLSALRKFITDHPASERREIVNGLIVTSQVERGNDLLRDGRFELAAKYFARAAEDAPVPIAEPLFTDILLKIPSELYWRGQRKTALDIAKILESKSQDDPTRLLAVARFYLSVEDGFDTRRIANKVIESRPDSANAYLALAFANRIDFLLEDSAAAYAKVLEFDSTNVVARQGLADMTRAVGKSDEAIALYRGLLTDDSESRTARTGLVLALFESNKKAEAETELTAALDKDPRNISLLSGVAYWYAANGNGKKAVEYAQRAIDIEPRLIWSHIALARGLMLERHPLQAERVLLAARRYGNFPTLQYEIASARLKAGLYREAAEELSKSFTIENDTLSTRLGGRSEIKAADFTKLLALERQASIFAPTAADTIESAAKVRELLQFAVNLKPERASDDELASSADSFVRGTDDMQVFRLLFAAQSMLEAKRTTVKAFEFSAAAIGKDEAGLKVPNPTAAVLADELYPSRRKADEKDEYVVIPDVPVRTLSVLMRGRIEELNGWSLLANGKADEAAVSLKRAASVLPPDSSWWRSSMWRLGEALVAAEKPDEALEAFVKCYKSDYPNIERYAVIQSLYVRLKGSADGLDKLVGENPAPGNSAAAKEQPIETPISAQAQASPENVPSVEATDNQPGINAAAATPSEPPLTETPADQQTSSAALPIVAPSPEIKSDVEGEDKTDKTVSKVTKPVESGETVSSKPSPKPGLFEPVVIIIPGNKPAVKTEGKPLDAGNKDAPAKQTEPDTAVPSASVAGEASSVEAPVCSIILSEETITLKTGGSLALIVRLEDDGDITGMTVVNKGADKLTVRLEPIEGIGGRALYVVSSNGSEPGTYSVIFELPCGKKELTVNVR